MTEEELMADASFAARVENLCVVLDKGQGLSREGGGDR